jgi:ring-1,2-phenylacetyl-CoA epoxidase subunit PaaC
VTAPPDAGLLPTYALRLADDLLINAQRLSEFITRGPELEEELAIANVALDNLGVAQQLYEYVSEMEGALRSADQIAFLRSEREFTNCLLVEQPHADFADVMGRQFFLDAWHCELWPALESSVDSTLAALAAKAAKEARYHFRHSAGWVIRLGDGTAESAARMQRAVNTLWKFTGELTTGDHIDREAAGAGIGVDPVNLRESWMRRVGEMLDEAGLTAPDDPYQATGGRDGRHTEHLGHLLAEMQFMQRAYPGMEW